MSDDVARIWREELEGAAKAVISAKILGTKIPMETITVEVELPAAMLKALRRACERLGLDEETVNQMASSMASSGFTKAIEDRFMDSQTPPAPQPVPQNPNAAVDQLMGEFKGGQIGMNGITERISQVQNLLTQLNGMAGMMSNGANSNPEAATNCGQPDVPSGKKDG